MKKITCVSLITAAALVACVPSAGAARAPTLRSSWSKSSWTVAPSTTDPRSRFEINS
jgi:hypothetical protein